eukprot:SAG11_NODE_160_length_14023_cov_23.003017_2_plen_120_part_00
MLAAASLQLGASTDLPPLPGTPTTEEIASHDTANVDGSANAADDDGGNAFNDDDANEFDDDSDEMGEEAHTEVPALEYMATDESGGSILRECHRSQSRAARTRLNERFWPVLKQFEYEL